jgi:hypothetical protein
LIFQLLLYAVAFRRTCFFGSGGNGFVLPSSILPRGLTALPGDTSASSIAYSQTAGQKL